MDYASEEHPLAYTVPEVAESAHVAGRHFAKTIILKLEGQLAMLVSPANQKVALRDVRGILGSDHVELACEDEFRDRFPDCEVGAMPPFGNLYGLPVYIATGISPKTTSWPLTRDRIGRSCGRWTS